MPVPYNQDVPMLLIPFWLLLGPQSGVCAGGVCTASDIEPVYLRGWEAAANAARIGGPPESLTEVKDAIATLARMAGGLHGPAEIAKYVLLAAIDASQDERDEMALFIEQAVALERQQLDAQQPGAPGISAHEAAGDLWLRVRRYEDARRAYEHAREVVGTTPRIVAGLARVEEALRR